MIIILALILFFCGAPLWVTAIVAFIGILSLLD